MERVELLEEDHLSLDINELKEEYRRTLWLLKPTQLIGVQSKARLLPNVTQPKQVREVADVIVGLIRGFSHSFVPFPNARVHTGMNSWLARSRGIPSHAPR